MSMKKLISAILLSAMLLTACGNNANANNTDEQGTAVSAEQTTTVSETTADESEDYIPKNEVGQGMLDYVLADYLDENANPELLTGERSERLEAAFQNIHINNSRFALPMMVNALPDGFTVEYDYSSEKKFGGGFNFYSGQLMCNNEMSAEIGIVKKDNAEDKYGIIVSIITLSNFSKWDFNGIKISNDTEKIIAELGEPSSIIDLGTNEENLIYINEIGTTIIFWKSVNAILTLNFNFDNTFSNALLIESVPYDDFEGMPEIPELSGEPREIDWNMLFEDDCIIIGNDKYPANVRISDLSEDIDLFEFTMGREFYSNKDYLKDTYLLMYKGREIAMVSAIRTKDQLPEEACMTSWGFTELDEISITGSICGVSFKQDFSDVPKIYLGSQGEDPGCIYSGTIEKDGTEYWCSFCLFGNSIVNVTLTPSSADPEYYNELVNSQ